MRPRGRPHDTPKESSSSLVDDFLSPREDEFIQRTAADGLYAKGIQAVSSFDAIRGMMTKSYRFLEIETELDETNVVPGAKVPFTVKIANHAQFAVPLFLSSSSIWRWSVDGLPEGEQQQVYNNKPGFALFPSNAAFELNRVFDGYIATDGTTGEVEYEPLAPGQHQLKVRLNVRNNTEDAPTDIALLTVDRGEPN